MLFIVQPDGEITHINVLRGIEPSLDREAVRILDGMPRWHAGRMGGNNVPVYCIFPITFRIISRLQTVSDSVSGFISRHAINFMGVYHHFSGN